MPRCCITKYLVESLGSEERTQKIVHYYDAEVEGFMLEERGQGRGTWYFRYRDAMGKWRYYRIGSLKSVSLTEARAKACVLSDLMRDGVDIRNDVHVFKETMKFELFVKEHYLPHAHVKKRSWDLDQRILRLHILPRFGRCRLDKIRRADVIAWQGELRGRGLAPASCNRVFVLFKTVLNCAMQWGAMPQDKDPCRGVRPFTVKGTKERYLTPEEARRLLQALDACSKKRSAQAIRLLLFTGARKSEILGARWEHVDMARRLLTVPLSKSGKARHIPLSDDAVRVLRAIPRGESPWVFPRNDGKGHITSVFTLWSRLRASLGLNDVRLHDLRHSFASFLVNAGRSLYEVQRCLGHCDPKVTMRYAHLTQNALVKAANTVGQAVQGMQVESQHAEGDMESV